MSLKNSKKLLVILLAMAAAAGIAVFSCTAQRAMAPAVTFLTLKGERIAMSDLRGKVVLVEFWATDCATCVREMPQLAATHEKYRARGYETIAVAMRYDPPNYVIAYAERNRLPFTVAFDPMGELARAFGEVKLTPTTFVIDRRGAIVARLLGERDFTRLHALIEEKLNEPA
ncbi:MAG: TlpA disulfide reductase family protein [Betaproteobacteria bacterium]